MNDTMKNKELISRYLDNEVTKEEKTLVEQLLIDDQSLQAYYRELVQLEKILNQGPKKDVSPDWEQRIQKTLDQGNSKEGGKMKKNNFFKIGAGGGVFAILILLMFFSMQVYVKRGIQGRLKSASDDIGDIGTSVGYEPYYLSTSYSLTRDGGSKAFVMQGQGQVPPTGPLQAGTITAGDIDDNLNLKSYKKYASDYLQSASLKQLPYLVTKDRISIKVTNRQGNPLGNTKIIVSSEENQMKLFESFTHSDGGLYLFPSLDFGRHVDEEKVLLSAETVHGDATTMTLNLADDPNRRSINIVFDEAYAASAVQLDLMFVIDTTGSMGDELNYLKKEFTDIVERINNQYPNVAIRYGLTLYRDEGDEYVVRNLPFTSSATAMQKQIENQSAMGGGDEPEAVHKALQTALKQDWNPKSTKMLFFVADAPPHDQFVDKTWDFVKEARSRGIHIYPVAASGVGDLAEYLMRSMALITQGRYSFLTDDSGVGNSHKEPSIPCYVVTRLNDLMVRVISSVISGQRVEPDQENIIRRSGYYYNGVCEEFSEETQ